MDRKEIFCPAVGAVLWPTETLRARNPANRRLSRSFLPGETVIMSTAALTLNLSEDLFLRLRALADAGNCSLEELVFRACEDFVEREEEFLQVRDSLESGQDIRVTVCVPSGPAGEAASVHKG